MAIYTLQEIYKKDTITDKDNGFLEQKKCSIREVANGEKKVSGL